MTLVCDTRSGSHTVCDVNILDGNYGVLKPVFYKQKKMLSKKTDICLPNSLLCCQFSLNIFLKLVNFWVPQIRPEI